MLEKQIEAKAGKLCKERGVLFYKFVSPSHRGVPDRILIFPNGQVVFCEFKNEKGVPTALQLLEQKRLSNNRAKVVMFYDYESFADWFDWQFKL